MERPAESPRYIVVSPVKDEELYIKRTLESMVNQTVRPLVWVIVDDGSTDRTGEIASRYEANYDFITVVHRVRGKQRRTGSPVILAFNTGYDSVNHLDHDFVVKLDCDLSFAPDYFEQLFIRFAQDPRLGIASGVYLESPCGKQWTEIAMPAYHAAGASKVVRRECFAQIGGFVAHRGWDTLDEIRSIAHGWRTAHFKELKMKHWKVEGSGIGQWRTGLMHGEIYYLTGGGLVFFLLKVLHRIARPPYLLGAIALSLGYLGAALRRKPLLVTRDESDRYRALLHARIVDKLTALRRFGSVGL